MKKFTIAFLCLLMVITMVTGVSAASYSNRYYQRLADHIDAYGVDSEDGMMLITKESFGSHDFYLVLRKQTNGFYFNLLVNSEESTKVVSSTEFVLTETSNYISVDCAVLYYRYGSCIDVVSTTKSINKTTFTSSSTYYVSGSGTYISASDFSEAFHSTLRALCSYWDEYIYAHLGFGLKALGFTSYDGRGNVACTSHTYDNSCDTTCNNCGATRSVSHAYSGSCDTACNVCGSIRTASRSHTWDEGEITQQPTCAATGVKNYTCTVCNETKTEIIDKTTDHTYGEWSVVDDTVHQHTCSVCNTAEFANHYWDQGMVTQQPTCAAAGVLTYTCEDCGGTMTEAIAKTTDHTYGKWSKVDDNTHKHTCTVCNAAESANHHWDEGVVTKQPTCAATGVKTYTCTDCGGTKTETIAKTNDHTYGEWTKVEDTNHSHKCSLCGKIETTAHKWDSGKITLMPTLDTTGLREHTCVDCGATKTEVVPKRANGDLDGDLEINNKDVEYLLWYTLFPESYPLEIFADFDGNGVVDNKDVEYLLWHTLFPESYPL